jgi:pimeloyl-ACP methyl ester carboxylesterase
MSFERVVAHLRIGNQQLDYKWLGAAPAEAPTLVFLHEGLGSVSMWRDFPKRVVEATGDGALVYSRAGYGDSDPVDLPRTVHFMHDEALITLPKVLDAMSIREAILIGHSDGGSIALIHAGGTKDARVRGLILEAPHVFVEEHGLRRISAIAEEYRNGDLRRRLKRHHGRNVDCAFWGWNSVWLDPEFRSWNIEEYLPKIRVPVLVIQGEDDSYGTLRQVEAIEKRCSGPVTTVILEDCGHSPHVDQPATTLEAIVEFVSGIA